MRVLGIETSCDDTAVALYDGAAGLVVHRHAGQVELHREFGGVVPELAARDHIRGLLPLVDDVIGDGGNGGAVPDAVAYTAGPGLPGALLVGAAVGKGLAEGWGVRAVAVHHMEGHLLAPMLEEDCRRRGLDFPMVALLVSGGHTMLVEAEGYGRYRVLGQTLDDAAGEAFDKTAKLLGLGYPGGPAIAKAALRGRGGRFNLTRPMVNRGGLDFSFSGLKTQVRGLVLGLEAEGGLDGQAVADIALEFEEAVVDCLAIKCGRALGLGGGGRGGGRLVLSGGVAANRRLRARLGKVAREGGAELFFPRAEFCTDNGAMIAYAGYLRLRELGEGGDGDGDGGFEIRPRWSLEELGG